MGNSAFYSLIYFHKAEKLQGSSSLGQYVGCILDVSWEISGSSPNGPECFPQAIVITLCFWHLLRLPETAAGEVDDNRC